MRSIMPVIFAAAFVAVPAISQAAPRGINDCEKIQAADAYNQCLALFGPVARGHRSVGAGTDNQDAAEANVENSEDPVATAAASNEAVDKGRHGRRHASRHGWARHHGSTHHARHEHWRHSGTAEHAQGKSKRLAFSVVPGRTRLR